MMAPDQTSLTRFVVAAKHLDLLAAASELGCEAEGLADSLRALEQQLGERLFNRRYPKLELTVAGRMLLPQARRALKELQRCVEVVHERDQPRPFSLTLGTRYELGMSWLVPSLDALQQACAERSIHLVFGGGAELFQRLERGQIDALVSSSRLHQSGLEYQTLHAEDYAFVAAPRLLARHPLGGPEDARRHTLVDTIPDLPLFRYLLDALEDAQPWPFERHEYMGTIAAIRHRVVNAQGVAVLPRYFIQQDLAQKRLVTLMSWLSLRQDAFRLVWRTGQDRDAELRDLGRQLARIPLR